MNDTPLPPTDSRLVTLEWLHDGRVIMITVNKGSREAVDAFVDAIEAARGTWSREQPFLAVYDVSRENVAFTPYARMKMTQLAENTPADLYGAYAIVLTGNIMSILVSIYIKMSRKKDSAFEHLIFSNREQAVAWITEKMHANNWQHKPETL